MGVGGLTAGRRGDRAVRQGGGPEIIAELREILAEATGRAELADVGEQVPLFGAGVGLDSLTGTLLLRGVHRRFGVDVADEDLNLDALATLGTLAAFIEEHTA